MCGAIMSLEAAEAVWIGVGGYLAVGLLLGGGYLLVGAKRMDAAADGASFWFRLIALPGAIAVWPFLAARWVTGARVDAASPEEQERAAP